MTPIENLIAGRRSDHHRLGFAVQLGTVRAVGRFLEDPLDVPWPAVEFPAEQLAIGDASCVKKYVQRPHAHLNCLGRYAFTTQPPTELRTLRDPNARDDSAADD